MDSALLTSSEREALAAAVVAAGAGQTPGRHLQVLGASRDDGAVAAVLALDVLAAAVHRAHTPLPPATRTAGYADQAASAPWLPVTRGELWDVLEHALGRVATLPARLTMRQLLGAAVTLTAAVLGADTSQVRDLIDDTDPDR